MITCVLVYYRSMPMLVVCANANFRNYFLKDERVKSLLVILRVTSVGLPAMFDEL